MYQDTDVIYFLEILLGNPWLALSGNYNWVNSKRKCISIFFTCEKDFSAIKKGRIHIGKTFSF